MCFWKRERLTLVLVSVLFLANWQIANWDFFVVLFRKMNGQFGFRLYTMKTLLLHSKIRFSHDTQTLWEGFKQKEDSQEKSIQTKRWEQLFTNDKRMASPTFTRFEKSKIWYESWRTLPEKSMDVFRERTLQTERRRLCFSFFEAWVSIRNKKKEIKNGWSGESV